MEKYKIKLIDTIKASKIWETSPNASIYNNPIFLKNFKNIKILAALKGDEIMCCWQLWRQKKMLIPNFFYYFGPYWSLRSYEQPDHSWLSTSKNIYTKFIEYLQKTLKRLIFKCIIHYWMLEFLTGGIMD